MSKSKTALILNGSEIKNRFWPIQYIQLSFQDFSTSFDENVLLDTGVILGKNPKRVTKL